MRLNELRETRLSRESGRDDDEGLTLTDLYTANPTWLQKAHLNLDRAVFAAYGWSHEISDDELLSKLLGLAISRANEQASATGTRTCSHRRHGSRRARRELRARASAVP
jgi:hypothetical protein